MPKVTMVGAGSAVFARQIITDILAIGGLDSGTFALVDIDAKRLELARAIAQKLVELSGKGWKVVASTDRTEVLPGTDYLVNSIEVAGLQNVRADYDIPLRYGVDQCIGDTIGPGGIFKALRTGPAWLDIVADAQRLAPRAMILNYTNPMSILTLAASRSTSQPVVGLCHSVQGTSRQLADYLSVPYEELKWRGAGGKQQPRVQHHGEPGGGREPPPPQSRVRIQHHRGGREGAAGHHLGQRDQRPLHRQPTRGMCRGRVQGRPRRLSPGAVRQVARAAGCAEPSAHGGARAGGPGAARARPHQSPARADARPAHRRRVLARL